MTKLVLVAVLFAGSIAAADPACAPSARVPKLLAVGGEPVVCWDPSGNPSADCVRDGKAIPRPPAVPRVAELRKDATGFSVCRGKTCKPVGPHLSIEIVGAQRDALDSNKPAAIVVSDDLARVLVPTEPAVWTVATDKRVALKPPVELVSAKPPSLVDVQLVGDMIVATWYPCAGPCGKGVLVDATGTNRGTWFDTADAAVFGDHGVVLATTGDKPRVVFVEMETGKRLAELALPSGHLGTLVTTLDANTVAVLSTDFGSTYDLTHVKLDGSKPSIVGKPVHFPICRAP